MRLFGSLAVFAEVSFFFIPVILAQNESRREPPSGWGRFKPGFPGFAALYDALPFAFKPPLGLFPSALCHAGVLAIYAAVLRVRWAACIDGYKTSFPKSLLNSWMPI